jgi:mannose/fructose/N-acetylgalactosamine-specific phosphotransferase system component IIB
MIDKIVKEVEFKSSYKDHENHINFSKNAFEELHKELLMKASIKDVCTLLDQKANVEDVNQTLSLV